MISINLKSQPGRNHKTAIALLEETLAIFKRDAESSRINYAHRKNGCRWVKVDGQWVGDCRCKAEGAWR